MSRAGATKARGADKTKPPASQTPVIAHEIVPGKFNEHDWNMMVDRDSSEEFVMEIIDNLMDTTMSTIYNQYIEKQLLPYTITQARDAIVEIIEWQFLSRDEGEVDIPNDSGWAEDEEPEPAVTDCWAQGSVPKTYIRPESPVLENIPEEQGLEEETKLEQKAEEEETREAVEMEDHVSDTEVDATASPDKKVELKEVPKPPEDGKRKKKPFRPYAGKVGSAKYTKTMTQSLDETEMKILEQEYIASMPPSEEKPSTLLNMPASCNSILKVQSGRPPGNKDVVYDDRGNVVAVMRLDPEKLPTHRVSVKYHVVDPAVEAAQARLDAMRKGRPTQKMKKTRSKKSLSGDSVTSGSKTKQSLTNQATVAPLPPPLIEEMEVASGVIVKEGGRVKKGPGRYYRKLDILEEHQKDLRPVSLRITNPGITVQDLLDRATPILRPMGDTPPLPPIVPHPPSHSQQVS